MIPRFVTLALAIVSGVLSVVSTAQLSQAAPFVDDFASGAERWDFAQPGVWSVHDGALHAEVTRGADTHALAKTDPLADFLIETELRFAAGSPRQNFGFVFRADDDHQFVLRYYDQPRALELLAFHGASWVQVGQRSAPLAVTAGKWHSMRLVAVGSTVLAKLWPSDQAEPDWQFHAQVDSLHAGRAGLVVHDAGSFEFRKFTLSTEALVLRDLQKRAEDERQTRLKQLRDSLRLAVAPREFPEAEGKTRVIEVAPFADADRYPVSGSLSWKMNGKITERQVTPADYRSAALLLEVAEPVKTESVEVTLVAEDGLELKNTAILEPAKLKPWRHYVQESIETLLEHGLDDYGPQKTPLIMAVLDTTTLRSPREPERLDAIVRLEGRIHRRAERGSNPWYDQELLNAMRRLSELTGEAKYAKAASAYLTHFLKNCNKPKDGRPYHTGLPAWGSHIYWNCYEERPDGDQEGSGPHEILVFRANWPEMYRLAPEEVRRLADGVWEHHIVDKKTGRHNRHDDGQAGCDFAFSGGSFLQLFAAMAKLTGESHYLDKAKTVADWHWKNRNEKTNLTADCPGLTGRYDGQHTFTTVCGPHAMTLLEASRVSGDDYFRQIATTYIKAYDRFAWDEQAQSYYAMLKLDGTPVPERAKGAGYDAYAPYGHVNVWRTTFYSYEFTLSAAQAAIQAYEFSGASPAARDPELLAIARRWATVIEGSMPAHTGRRWKKELEESMPLAKETGGAYAEDYGRAISFFVHLHRATAEKHHLDLANRLAEDAVRKLYHHGLFKGHPAKPYYETTNGVGLLLYALLELDAPNEPLEGAL